MPAVNYCRKCKTEVSLGESCPHCGGKLAKTGERISFGVVRVPYKDWFAWNRLLRVGLSVLLLVFALTICAEWAAGGERAAAALLAGGFLSTMALLTGLLLLLVFLLLLCQGPEKVHYVLDKEGASACAYLADPAPLQLYARFLTPAAVKNLVDDQNALPGLTLVRRVFLPWSAVRRAQIWREGGALLFYRPAYWQVLAVRCPLAELPAAEAYLRARLKRVEKCRVLPGETKKR